MGHIFTDAYLEGLVSGEKVRMLVDTGATFSVISNQLADRLGLPKLPARKVKLADGTEVNTEVGMLNIKVNGREVPTMVLIMGEEALLGVETLETLGLKVNPETGKLEPTRSYTIRA